MNRTYGQWGGTADQFDAFVAGRPAPGCDGWVAWGTGQPGARDPLACWMESWGADTGPARGQLPPEEEYDATTAWQAHYDVKDPAAAAARRAQAAAAAARGAQAAAVEKAKKAGKVPHGNGNGGAPPPPASWVGPVLLGASLLVLGFVLLRPRKKEETRRRRVAF